MPKMSERFDREPGKGRPIKNAVRWKVHREGKDETRKRSYPNVESRLRAWFCFIRKDHTP